MAHYLITVRSRRHAAAPHHLYLLAGELSADDVQRLADELLHDPVVQQTSWCLLDALDADPAALVPSSAHLVEVAYNPGVTDNEAESVKIGALRLGITGVETVRTLRRYVLTGPKEALAATLKDLYNPLIQTTLIQPPETRDPLARQAFYDILLRPPLERSSQIDRVALLDATDEDLLRISQAGVLSLDLDEMRTIQAYFRREEREPTDGELETLAQTWSEHCSHKTFKSRVRYRGSEMGDQRAEPGGAQVDACQYTALRMLRSDCEIDSLIRTFLMSATKAIMERQQSSTSPPWVLSAFVDNAGIVAFGDAHEVSIKVETHNHPSALEPFGGANTGVGGVVRDVMGVSAQPIANTDVLCFGPLDMPAEALAEGVIHPHRVAAGVVAGIRDYGNKLGIPTVNGAVLYDKGYVANPLVFCGTIGLAPRGTHPRDVKPGDAVVVLGGRTGRDGIHGATFSSAELTHTTAQEVGSAVQIGDPITEKKMLDVILQARDAGLYSAITDCGAGGLSSAVGEMGAHTGAAVELAHVPLKYAGLQPWEIWLSEAQERMVLAVPQHKLATLLELCASEDVEATVIGQFTDNGRLIVRHRGAAVVDLSMEFLHDGRPQRLLEAVWEPTTGEQPPPLADSPLEILRALLAHPNIASKESIVRTYDHEVLGQTVIKPLVGVACDGPGDAAVLQPVRSTALGLAIGCGINPRYGLLDPYWMALACIDEALRNVVSVGGDPRQTAILDNFCWGDPRQPDRMAGLVRAAAGCYDAAVAFGTPFISGKDSLNNEYRAADGTRIPIPPTLLITALALVPDVGHAVTMDLKEPGNLLYLVGETRAELGGSHYYALADRLGSSVPQVDLRIAPQIFSALHQAISSGLVRACHDLSEGGLAVAAAEMAFAGGCGLELDLRGMVRSAAAERDDLLLFAESPSRFLVEVRPADAVAFEAALTAVPIGRVGQVNDGQELRIIGLSGEVIMGAGLTELKGAWQQTAVV